MIACNPGTAALRNDGALAVREGLAIARASGAALRARARARARRARG